MKLKYKIIIFKFRSNIILNQNIIIFKTIVYPYGCKIIVYAYGTKLLFMRMAQINS